MIDLTTGGFILGVLTLIATVGIYIHSVIEKRRTERNEQVKKISERKYFPLVLGVLPLVFSVLYFIFMMCVFYMLMTEETPITRFTVFAISLHSIGIPLMLMAIGILSVNYVFRWRKHKLILEIAETKEKLNDLEGKILKRNPELKK